VAAASVFIDCADDSTAYTYDSCNREVRRRFSNTGNMVVTRCTQDRKPDTVIDHRGMPVYTFDMRGRQAKVTNPDGTFIGSR
jgi:hypothetical protein